MHTSCHRAGSVLKGQIAGGDSFVDLSEFVTLTVKFLSGHTVPVGIEPTHKWHLLAAVFSHCSLAIEKTATDKTGTFLYSSFCFIFCVFCLGLG